MKRISRLISFVGVIAICMGVSVKALRANDTHGANPQPNMSDHPFRVALRSAHIPAEFAKWSQTMVSNQVNLEEKTIYIGHWLPVTSRIAVSRLKSEVKFFLFSIPDRWFNGGVLTSTIEPTAGTTDLFLISGDRVLSSGTIDTSPEHAVLFTADYIYVVDLSTFSGISYNRGYH
jgi:hypothetical protein